MRRAILYISFLVVTALVFISACTHKPQLQPAVLADGGFPDSVANILITQCATAGCHNQASYQLAAGLLLDNYAHLLAGSNFGAEVVAYSTQFSDLLPYMNAYDSSDAMTNDPGHIAVYPTRQQYLTIKNWIAHGAPDKNGNIPFASNPDTRQKIYVAISSGCNQIAVIDAQSHLVMRYITVGGPNNYNPHDVKVSSDGAFAYVSLYTGTEVQKIDTRTDSVIASTDLSAITGGSIGYWSIINLSPMDTAIMVSGWTSPGFIASINTANMTVNTKMSVDIFTGGTSSFPLPHGIASNAAYDTFFAALQDGNVVNRFSFSPTIIKQVLVKGSVPILAGLTGANQTPDPHQLQMLPDYSKYFVTCQGTNEVRVMDAHTGKLLDSIPVGSYPQDMDISPSKGYIFVACYKDAANPNGYGSVYVIDYNTDKVVDILYGDFFAPHEMAVDEQDGLLFICSTNLGGNAHHAGLCGGPDGWYSVYDLNTLKPVDTKRYEVPQNPYTVSVRFK